ncbi:UbiA family prenyltransferase [Actinomadura sp. 7K534]|uniref:UbiA family prenyltransferase n=1 Tax=Actinomadura sp. 7K534 TaxID=2530366 RepID=UPI00104B8BA3|nr:UbiA family prenyltransferase [Actinomadura sp. 7K534]TDB92364.1 hypothetical protein E1266_24425 [Actinomadura sp. 7K534]
MTGKNRVTITGMTTTPNAMRPVPALREALAIARLCVLEARPSVLVISLLRFLAAAALGAGVAAAEGGTGDAGRACVAAAAWLGGVFAVYLFNGVMDRTEDRVNGSRRPIVRGALPTRLAAQVTVAAAIVSLALMAAIGADAVWALLLYLAIGIGYSGPPLYLKRRPITSSLTGMSLALLTYYAGFRSQAEIGASSVGVELTLFMAAMVLWIGTVGMLSKDFSDISGDVAAGRRSIPARIGEAATLRLIVVCAFVLAISFCVAAGTFVRPLLWPGFVMLAGAVAMAAICLGPHAAKMPRRRLPYRAFMVTQHACHSAAIIPLWVTPAI